jgi:hypothetical protein
MSDLTKAKGIKDDGRSPESPEVFDFENEEGTLNVAHWLRDFVSFFPCPIAHLIII